MLLEEFHFVSKHREYFVDHSLKELSPEFVKRIGDLSESKQINNTLEFLHYIDKLIRDSKESVWLQVDQYPLTSLSSIMEGQKRGVKFRIIEQNEMISGPHLYIDSPDDASVVMKTRSGPFSEQTMLNEVGVFMFISEDKCAVAFPSTDAKFDYHGFAATDKRSLKWCRDLFQHYWNLSKSSSEIAKGVVEEDKSLLEIVEPGIVFVVGRESLVDAVALQQAVDNYDEVRLRGVFDLGTSTIKVSRSVNIRGEGISNGIPKTIIYKRGWSYPFTGFESVFEINGKNIDVVIENLHFTDFNGSCINAQYGKSLKISGNAITLYTGYGRGWKLERYGEVVAGIWVDAPPGLEGSLNFRDGIVIERNYIDFSYIPTKHPIQKPTIHGVNIADPQTEIPIHQDYFGVGVKVLNMSTSVVIENNKIYNMNGRGMCITDNFTEADIKIKGNIIESEIPGSYPFNGEEAGLGIFAQSAFLYNRPGFTVTIDDNNVRIKKPNYTGIKVLGASATKNKSKSLQKGHITNNKIYLEDGQAGIEIDDEHFVVSNNEVSGNAYFGIHMHNLMSLDKISSQDSGGTIRENDLSKLKLKDTRMWIKRSRPVIHM